MTLTLRQRWYLYLNEPTSGQTFSLLLNVFLALVIIVNIVEVVLSSVSSIAREMGSWSLLANYAFALVFGLEYVTRVWVAAETPHENNAGPWHRRAGYMLSSMGLIDLLSFLPVVLWILLPNELFEDFRVLKVISMVRVLKLTRYSASLAILSRVYRENRNILLAAGLIMLILTFMAATGIYLFERRVQPEAFGSIPSAMWWALVTLTTVGYGDLTPLTLGGKLFGAIVMVCGVGIAAMPAGIFASSFVQLIREQERERRRKRREAAHKRRLRKAAQLPDEQHSAIVLQVEMSRSEQREVDYLIEEFGLTLDQAVGVVMHFRH